MQPVNSEVPQHRIHTLDLTLHPYLVRVGGIDGGRFSNLPAAVDSAKDAQYQMASLHARHVEWEIVDGSRKWASDMRMAG